MLNNIRRKRVQRLDIEKYEQHDTQNTYWQKDEIVCGWWHSNLGNQRYSKRNTQESFEYYRPKKNLIPFFKVGDAIYNLILCPSGSFTKGWANEKDNKPQEMKIKKAFLLGETEITQELYYAVMKESPSHFAGNPKNPVENVSWYDALIFCNKLSDWWGLARYYTITKDGKIIDTTDGEQEHYIVEMDENAKGFRLPTDTEWEYAVKAGSELEYSGSDDLDEIAWYKENSKINKVHTTHPVKLKKPNAWGFYDMSGNVFEWCESLYDQNAIYVDVRGGDYGSDPFSARTTSRARNYMYSRLNSLGFRVARYI